MNLCIFVFPLQIGSGLFAALAAILWFYASSIKTPTAITTIIVGDGAILGELDEIARALVMQGKWNSRAAFCAALSAAGQVGGAFMPTCWEGW
jgi:hypothetical protein